jgi:hypothetical protein
MKISKDELENMIKEELAKEGITEVSLNPFKRAEERGQQTGLGWREKLSKFLDKEMPGPLGSKAGDAGSSTAQQAPTSSTAQQAPTSSTTQQASTSSTTQQASTSSEAEDFIAQQFGKKVPLETIRKFANLANLDAPTARKIVKVVRDAGYTLSEGQIKRLKKIAGSK